MLGQHHKQWPTLIPQPVFVGYVIRTILAITDYFLQNFVGIVDNNQYSI